MLLTKCPRFVINLRDVNLTFVTKLCTEYLSESSFESKNSKIIISVDISTSDAVEKQKHH